jgi:hypothetical protein
MVMGYFEFSADPVAKATYQSVMRFTSGINIKMDSQGLKPIFLKIRQHGVITRRFMSTITNRCIGRRPSNITPLFPPSAVRKLPRGQPSLLRSRADL